MDKKIIMQYLKFMVKEKTVYIIFLYTFHIIYNTGINYLQKWISHDYLGNDFFQKKCSVATGILYF